MKKELRWVLIASGVIYLIQLLTLRQPMTLGEPYLIAKNVVSGLGFAFSYPLDTVVQTTCYIPPLYVYFVAGIMKLGGGDGAIQTVNLLFLQLANISLFFFLSKFFSFR